MKFWEVFIIGGDLDEIFFINCLFEFLEFFLELYI